MLQYNALFCKCQYIWLSSEDERRWGVLLSIHLHLAIVEQDVTNLFNWMVVGGGPFSVKDVLFCAREVLLFLNDFFSQAALEKDKEKALKESLTLKASVTTMTAKVETLSKNIEQQKQTEKELQVS